jgi:hypothetical protein
MRGITRKNALAAHWLDAYVFMMMKAMNHRFVSVLAILWSGPWCIAACTVTQAAPGTSDAGPGATGAAARLSCVQVWQCIVDCPDADQACPDACVDKADEAGKSKLVALADCIQTKMCTDASCLQTQCQAPLAACLEAPAAARPPAPTEIPAGDVPADLVGSWVNVNSGTTVRLVLNADGTASYLTGFVSNIKGCFSTKTTTEIGNAVATADTITLYSNQVVLKEVVCSTSFPKEGGTPTVISLPYTREDANTLKTITGECAAKYAGSDYSIKAYCTERLKRE